MDPFLQYAAGNTSLAIIRKIAPSAYQEVLLKSPRKLSAVVTTTRSREGATMILGDYVDSAP